MLSPAVALARISKVSPAFTVPLRAGSPSRRVTGIGSPVSAASSIMAPGTQNDPVDGDHLASAHENDVAYSHLFNWNVSNGRISDDDGQF